MRKLGMMCAHGPPSNAWKEPGSPEQQAEEGIVAASCRRRPMSPQAVGPPELRLPHLYP